MINSVNDTNNKMNGNTEQKKNVKIVVPVTFSEMLLNMKIKE